MIQTEKFLAEIVTRLPGGPERARLAGWLQEAIDYNAGKKPEAASEIDLRQQTYDLLHLVRQPSEQEREALIRRGIVFLPLETKSYAQVVAGDPGHFREGELAYVNARPQLRDYVLPVAVEAGFNPVQPALPGSFGKSRPVQLRMIENCSQQLQTEYPDARVIMLPSTGDAQADRAYKVSTGKVLFRNYFARALDDFFLVDFAWVFAAGAGRHGPSGRFHVGGWFAGDGRGVVGAVPAVVFVGNK